MKSSSWDITSILLDAIIKFDEFNLKYDRNSHDIKYDIEVSVHQMDKCDSLGFVISTENRRVIHLNSRIRDNDGNNCPPFNIRDIRNTIVHEYFHHAQSRSGNVFNTYYVPRQWLYEGTAVWFHDEVYDDDNYRLPRANVHIGHQFLDKGLTTSDYKDSVKRYLFFKLLQKSKSGITTDDAGCNFVIKNNQGRTFLEELFDGHKNNDDGGSRIKNIVESNEFDCDFGNAFGNENRKKFATALEYFTYAIQIRKDISLIDKIKEPTFNDYESLPKWITLSDYIKGESLEMMPLSSVVVKIQDDDTFTNDDWNTRFFIRLAMILQYDNKGPNRILATLRDNSGKLIENFNINDKTWIPANT